LDPRGFIIADTTCVAGSQSDKAILSPGRSPRVFDFVVGAGHSHQKNVVVEIVFAVVENARAISAPVSGISTYTNGS